MMNAYTRFVMLCALPASLGLSCGGDSSAAKPASAGASADSGKGGDGTKAGAGGSAGSRPPTPPPEMPRQLGSPDGIYCQSQFNDPPAETCSAGSRCCPGDSVTNTDPVCMADQGKCPVCDSTTCAQLLCDGPEDCSAGQFCCYSRRTCGGKPEDCTPKNSAFMSSNFMDVECQARCVDDQRDPDHGAVVCKDDHDCPGRYVAGRCKSMPPSELPYGLKFCTSL